MSGTTPRGGEGRDSDRVLAELEEEITSWLEQGGMNLMTVLNGQGAADEVNARSTIRGLLEKDGFGRTETVGRAPGLPDRRGVGSDLNWSNVVATYIDYLSSSLLPYTGDGGSTMSFGFDEGHAGGCG
ncbi:hypothetical protein [Streptomyces sp. Tu 3180]|uniref:hypothetical protein n=1 Tax=Streptomyces sp. Tu 3180 TaxID=2682611 RepID=UPI001357E853|nr:hypothetical protein [Streptomyces sp. Tu 3180]KAF3468170.1 hypothetical protein GL259_30370 [Streptomyces sp. Tu 3180]